MMINRLKSLRQQCRQVLTNIVIWLRLAFYLLKVRNDQDLRMVCCSYLGWMPLCLFSEPALWLKLLLNSRHRFGNLDQRPRSFYVPHLKTLPFNQPNSISKFLEDHWSEICQEFYTIEHLEVKTPSSNLIEVGTWNTFPLMRAAKEIKENIALCPITWSIVNQCPLLRGVRGGVYFSIIYPGTHIESHCGPSNLKLRYHLTIEAAEGVKIRAGQTWHTWRKGECLILDDSFEHEVIHNGDKRRVVLIVDCWNSDLSEKEILFLTKVHQIWRGKR